jgi:hypothetical protein
VTPKSATLNVRVPDDWTQRDLLDLVVLIRQQGVRCAVLDHDLPPEKADRLEDGFESTDGPSLDSKQEPEKADPR